MVFSFFLFLVHALKVSSFTRLPTWSVAYPDDAQFAVTTCIYGLGLMFGGAAFIGSLSFAFSCPVTATTVATVPAAAAPAIMPIVVPVIIPVAIVVVTPIVVEILVPATVAVTDEVPAVVPAVKLDEATPSWFVDAVTLAPEDCPELRVPPSPGPRAKITGTSGTGRSFSSVTCTCIWRVARARTVTPNPLFSGLIL
jgi:hypothetical protein